MEKVSLLVNNQKITGTIIKPQVLKKQNPGVVFFHGLTSSEKGYIEIAEQLVEKGFISLTINLRGHGTSQGDFNKLTVNDAILDGLTAYDFFSSLKYVDKTKIGLAGTSVGATVASIISSQRPVKSMVLRVPATYTEEMMRLTFNQIMKEENKIFKSIDNIAQTPAIKAIKKFTGSLLLLPSENDSIIPLSIPQAYFSSAKNTAKKEIIIIKKATHNLSANMNWRKQYIKLLIGWFYRTLSI